MTAMRIPRRSWPALLACAGGLALTGCGSDDPESGGAGAAARDGAAGKQVTLVSCAASNPNCNALNAAIVEGIEAAGAKVTTLENDFDAAAQVQQLNQAIAQKPDLIVLLATDTKSVSPAIRKAKAAGVPLINIDGPVDAAVEDDLTAQIVPDNAQLGRFAAQNIIEGLQAAGLDEANVVAITGTKASRITSDRMDGFNEEMAKQPGYEVVAVEDGDWDAVKSGKIAQELFAKYASEGGIQAAYGMADYQAVPIIQAAKQAGLAVGAEDGGLVVTGSNCTKAGVDAIKAGTMFGTATADPMTQGGDTAEWIVKYLEGEEIEPMVVLPQDRITRENVDEWVELCSVS